MTFAIDKWKKNGWKIALWSAFGLLAIKFAIWPLLQGAYDKVHSVGKKEIGITEWLPNFGPYWLVALALIVVFFLLIWAGAKDGKTAGERMKKASEVAFAFAKLVTLVLLGGVFFVFLVGPKYFWGDYYAPPPQTPAVQVQRGITTQAGATPDHRRIDILAPVGTLATPLGEWGGPLHLYGRRSQMDARANDGTRREGVLAVNADGVIHIIGPGLDPDIGKPNTLRFLSLTNFPLQISGRIE